MYRNPIRADQLESLHSIQVEGDFELVNQYRTPELDLCVEKLLQNPDSTERLSALRKLDSTSIAGYVHEVERAMYFDPELDVRVQAAFVLAKEKAPSPIPFVIEATLCGDSRITKQGVRLLQHFPEQVNANLTQIIERYRFVGAGAKVEVINLVSSTFNTNPRAVVDFLREVVCKDSSDKALHTAARKLSEIDHQESLKYFAALLKPAGFLSTSRAREQHGALRALVYFRGEGQQVAIDACQKYLSEFGEISRIYFPKSTEATAPSILPKFIRDRCERLFSIVSEPVIGPYRNRMIELTATAVNTLDQLVAPDSAGQVALCLNHPITAVRVRAHEAVREHLEQGAPLRWHLVQVWNRGDLKSRQLVGELIVDFKLKSLYPVVIKALGDTTREGRAQASTIVRSLDSQLHDGNKARILQHVCPGQVHLALEVMKLVGQLDADFTSHLCSHLKAAIAHPDVWHEDVVLELISMLGKKGGAESIDVLISASESSNACIREHAGQMQIEIQRRFKE